MFKRKRSSISNYLYRKVSERYTRLKDIHTRAIYIIYFRWIMKDSHIDFVEALLQNLDLRQQNIDRLNKLVDYINNK